MAGVASGSHPSKEVFAELLEEYPNPSDAAAREYVSARLRGAVSIPRRRPTEPRGRAWLRAVWGYFDVAVYEEIFRREGSRGPRTKALERVRKRTGYSDGHSLKRALRRDLKDAPAFLVEMKEGYTRALRQLRHKDLEELRALWVDPSDPGDREQLDAIRRRHFVPPII